MKRYNCPEWERIELRISILTGPSSDPEEDWETDPTGGNSDDWEEGDY